MITIRVPASSANLGPGFDTLGLALDLPLTVTASTADRWSIEARGRDRQEIPTDTDENLIVKSARLVAEREGMLLPPLALTIDNRIPITRGLGSSGAATVAGVLLADSVCGLRLSRPRLLSYAAEIEGHPDNVAASLCGGLNAACADRHGDVLRLPLPIHPSIRAILVVPDCRLETALARSVLPSSYERRDVVHNLQRTTLLAAALADPDPALVREAMHDCIHQPYRRTLVKGMDEILEIEPIDGLLGVAISGSGPSVLALATHNDDAIGERISALFHIHGMETDVLLLGIEFVGANVQSGKSLTFERFG